MASGELLQHSGKYCDWEEDTAGSRETGRQAARSTPETEGSSCGATTVV